MTDRHLDDAIDRTVREMMSVDARTDVRPRVLSRIGPAGVSSVSWLKVAGASAAAAAIAAFVLLGTPGPPVEPAPAPVSRGSDIALPPSSGLLPSTAPPAPRAAHSRTRVTAAVLVEEHVSSVEITRLAIDPIAIAPIRHQSIAPSTLAVEPLAPIPEVHVEPLTHAWRAGTRGDT